MTSDAMKLAERAKMVIKFLRDNPNAGNEHITEWALKHTPIQAENGIVTKYQLLGYAGLCLGILIDYHLEA